MKRSKKEAFPYDPAPMQHAFEGQPEDCFDLVNGYGTYELQRTADTENAFPAIAQGLPKSKRNKPYGDEKKSGEP